MKRKRDDKSSGRADLAREDLRRADLSKAALVGADLRGADLRAANLRDADLTGACLLGARLEKTDLRGAVLSGARAAGEFFAACDLSGARLAGNDLELADFSGSRLADADLTGASLAGASFRDCDMTGAKFTGADLRGADLRGARLSGADLSNADLRGARLRGTDVEKAALRQARLWGAKGLTAEQAKRIAERGGDLYSPRTLRWRAAAGWFRRSRPSQAVLAAVLIVAAASAWRYWRDPRNRPAGSLNRWGAALAARNEFEKAADVYGALAERLAGKGWSEREARLSQAWCYARLGRYEAALELCSAVLEKTDGDFDRSQILLRMGEIYDQSGDLAGAARCYRRVSENKDLPGPRFQSRTRLLDVESRRGNAEEAVRLGGRYLKESAGSAPESAEYHRIIGGILRGLGRAAGAAEHFGAIAESADDPALRVGAWMSLIELDRSLTRSAAAAEKADRLLADFRDHPALSEDARLLAADAYLEAARFDDARAQYRLVRDGDPRRRFRARMGQAHVLRAKGDKRAALDEYRDILDDFDGASFDLAGAQQAADALAQEVHGAR